MSQNALVHKFVAFLKASVEIYRPDEGFKGISTNVIALRCGARIETDEFAKSHLLRQQVERGALYHLAAHIGQKTFSPARKFLENNVADDGLKHSIA